MNGDEYLRHMIGPAIKSLDKDKAQAVEYIFNRMCNRGVDPIEFFDNMRILLDIKDREGESTKPKLYLLNSNISVGGQSRTAVILAMNEIEARLNAAIECFEDSFLDNSSCVEVNTSTCSVVTYTYDYD